MTEKADKYRMGHESVAVRMTCGKRKGFIEIERSEGGVRIVSSTYDESKACDHSWSRVFLTESEGMLLVALLAEALDV